MLAQATDSYFIKSGAIYLAWTNWEQAKENLATAETGLEEALADLPELDEEYEAAKWDLDRANNREEYEHFRDVYDDIKSRRDSVLEKRNTAQDIVDHLTEEVPNLKEIYDTAVGELETEA